MKLTVVKDQPLAYLIEIALNEKFIVKHKDSNEEDVLVCHKLIDPSMCGDCYFKNKPCFMINCNVDNRSDNQAVYFHKVEKNTDDIIKDEDLMEADYWDGDSSDND